jgi:hypothetical protein
MNGNVERKERTTKGVIIEEFFLGSGLHVSWMFHDTTEYFPQTGFHKRTGIASPTFFVLLRAC